MAYSIGYVALTSSPLPAIGRVSSIHDGYRPIDGWLKHAWSGHSYGKTMKEEAASIAGFLQAAGRTRANATAFLGASTLKARQVSPHAPEEGLSAIGAARDGAAVKSYRVTVGRLAESQRNVGDAFDPADRTAIRSGTNRFGLSIGGRTKNVKVEIGETDTNEKALSKIKDAINGSGAGVKASLVRDRETSSLRLELTGSHTGKDNGFAIADETGNAVAATGIGSVARQAADAKYFVDGGDERSSATNEIVLEKGKTTATLLKPDAAGGTGTTIDVRPDVRRIAQAARSLVDGYNDTLDRLRDAGELFGPAAKRSLDQAIGQSDDLADVGIRRGADGKLKLDESRLSDRVLGDFGRAGGSLTNFAKKLEHAFFRFSEASAGSLVNDRAQRLQPFSAYGSAMKPKLRYPGTGLLVDELF